MIPLVPHAMLVSSLDLAPRPSPIRRPGNPMNPRWRPHAPRRPSQRADPGPLYPGAPPGAGRPPVHRLSLRGPRPGARPGQQRAGRGAPVPPSARQRRGQAPRHPLPDQPRRRPQGRLSGRRPGGPPGPDRPPVRAPAGATPGHPLLCPGYRPPGGAAGSPARHVRGCDRPGHRPPGPGERTRDPGPGAGSPGYPDPARGQALV